MRYLTVILGILAVLVTLGGPVAALAVTARCHDVSMATMATPDDMGLCKPAAKACMEPCLAMGNCQSQYGSTMPFSRLDADVLVSPLFSIELRMVDNEHPPGTNPPVDGPPPRL